MQQNPQIVPVHAELAADLVLFLLLEEKRPQELLVLLRQPAQGLADVFPHLFGVEHPVKVHRGVRRIERALFACHCRSGGAVKLL